MTPNTTQATNGARTNSAPAQEDTEALIQGLTREQLQILAEKVYDLLLDELRIEAERHGQVGFR